MAHRRAKPKIGFSSDVSWYAPHCRQPIATSTVATKDTLGYFFECGYNTPNKMLQAIQNHLFLGGCEELLIIQAYIDRGFGDLKMNIE